MILVEGSEVGFQAFNAVSIRSALDFTVAGLSVG
jgi:hypothetical protein